MVTRCPLVVILFIPTLFMRIPRSGKLAIATQMQRDFAQITDAIINAFAQLRSCPLAYRGSMKNRFLCALIVCLMCIPHWFSQLGSRPDSDGMRAEPHRSKVVHPDKHTKKRTLEDLFWDRDQ